MRDITSVHGSEEYVRDPRYRVVKTPRVGQDAQAGAMQDRAYQVCGYNIRMPPVILTKGPYLLVAMSTLMFPLGSNPSS